MSRALHTNPAPHALTRLMSFVRPRATAFVAGAALLFTAACRDSVVAPAAIANGTTATLGFNAQVVSTGGTAELRVTSSYLQVGGNRVVLGTQSATLADAPEQLVPLSIDLGACLRDAQRQSGTVPASPDDCLVQLELQLVVDGQVVDRQTVGPLALRGGQSQTIADAVTLRDVGEIRVRAGSDDTSTRVEVGRTVALSALVFDGAQRPLAGRTITWATDAPNIATVSATGVVTAVSQGTARITASTGGRTGSIEVRSVFPPQTLRILPGGVTGVGTVRSVPAGIDCTLDGTTASGACAADFPSDVTVELTTTTASGTEFVGWSGNCGGTVGPVCRVSMLQAVTTGPVLRALGTITVTAAGTGTGLVTSDVGTISCQMASGITAGTCSSTYVQGTLVLLRATASGASSFLGWTGACSGSGPTCVVEVNAAKTVTARFELQVALAVQGTGIGNGTVVSSPAGISCSLAGGTPSGVCTALFTQGTTVTLTASASGTSTLRRWGGACSTATGNTCTLVTTGTLTATAQFEPPATVSVAPTGNGAGTVTGGLINCSRSSGSNFGTCSTSVPAGTSVTLTATAVSGNEFIGWTGACSGSTAPTCTFVAERSTLVSAAFRSLAAVIEVQPNAASTGLGSVFTSDERLSCDVTSTSTSGTCTLTEVPGTEITLLSFADGFSTFAGWGGACAGAGTASSCTLTVTTGTTTVSARFDLLPTTDILFELTGSAGGTLNVSGPGFSRSCTRPAGSSSSTLCTIAVPQNVAFDVFLTTGSGVIASFTSPMGQPCAGVSGTSCSVPGRTTSAAIWADFTPISALRRAAVGGKR